MPLKPIPFFIRNIQKKQINEHGTAIEKIKNMERDFSRKRIKEEVLDLDDDIDTEISIIQPNMSKKQLIGSWNAFSWNCYYCTREFDKFETLKSHIQTLHNISKPEDIHYQCVECKVHFFSYANFVSHIRSVHQNSLKLCCDVCSEVFANFKQLSNHRSTHKGINIAQPIVYQCMLCEVAKSTEKQLKDHIQKSHIAIKYKMENSDPLEISQNSSNMEDHFSPLSANQYKNEYFDVEHIYQCGNCKHNFENECDFETHRCFRIEPREHGESVQLLKAETRRKPHKRKANWSQGAESLLCEVWKQKIDTLRSTRRTWHIYNEMRQTLDELGCHLTIEEIKTKIHNLTSRYNKEKINHNSGVSSDWPLFTKLHQILGSCKNNDETPEETITFTDKKTEMETTDKNNLPDINSDDISASYQSSSDLSESFETKKFKANELVENPAQVTEEHDELCETSDKLTFKIYQEKVKQTKLMQKMYEEEAKKTKLMEKFVSDNTEFKNAFIKFLSTRK